MWYLGYGKMAVILSVNLEYSNEVAKKIKAAKDYVSKLVGADKGEERIQRETTPPATVKCMPSCKKPTYLPSNRQDVGHGPWPSNLVMQIAVNLRRSEALFL